MYVVICPYCGNVCHFDNNKKNFIYRCSNCKSSVTANNINYSPLGIPASKELARLRYITHFVFDKFMLQYHLSKDEAYRWLSGQLNLPLSKTHIGLFNTSQCKQAIKAFNKTMRIKQGEYK